MNWRHWSPPSKPVVPRWRASWLASQRPSCVGPFRRLGRVLQTRRNMRTGPMGRPPAAGRMWTLPAARLTSCPARFHGAHLLLHSPPPARHFCSRHWTPSVTPLRALAPSEQSAMPRCGVRFRSGPSQRWSWSGGRGKAITQYSSRLPGGARCRAPGNGRCPALVPGFGLQTGRTDPGAPLC